MKYINMKNISRIVFSTVLCVGMTACDYLDVVPPETPDVNDTMRDKQDALGFLYGCYYNVASSIGIGAYGQHETSVDECVNPVLWGRLGQIASWNQLSATYSSNNGNFQLPWSMTYDAIGQCNLFEKILNESSPKEVTLDDRRQWLAEIKFLRAYYHFRLLESYGPVPIIDHFYSSDTSVDQMPGRSHFDYCVDHICDWLDEAATDLPNTRELADLGRATAPICKALKSRILLYAASPLWNGSFPHANWRNTRYQTPGYGYELVSKTYDREKWVRAREAAKEAISLAIGAGKRSFYTMELAEMQRKMEEVPLPDIPGTDEEFRKKVMHIRYANTTTESEGNREVVWAVVPDHEKYMFWQVDHYPHAVLLMNGGGYSGGVCALAPILYAVEHFYTNNGLLPKHDSEFPESEWFKSAGLSRGDIIKLNKNREPRFYANFSFDGDEYASLICDGEPLILRLRVSNAQGYNPDRFNMDNNVTGYMLKKWVQPNIAIHPNGAYNARMYAAPYIKLAELYLNLAECEAALDNTSGALDAINEVRKHAEIRDLTTDDLTVMSLTEWVRNERYIELFTEGHRYYDLRRWMIAPDALKNSAYEGLNAIEKKDPTFEEFNVRTKIDQPFQWDERMYMLPVPSSEVYNNPQLIQAPGY